MGGFNGGRTVVEKGNGNSIHFGQAGEMRERSDGLQGSEYARRPDVVEEVQRVMNQDIIFIRLHVFAFNTLVGGFRRDPMAGPLV